MYNDAEHGDQASGGAAGMRGKLGSPSGRDYKDWYSRASGRADNPDEAALQLGIEATALAVGGEYLVAAIAWARGAFVAGRGLGIGNPFLGRTAAEIDAMFRMKGFSPRGPNPAAGKGGYVNTKTGRSYHIDEANRFGEAPHVDVNRSRSYTGSLEKKKYEY